MLFIFRHDTPKFYKDNDKKDEYSSAMQAIYIDFDPKLDAELNQTIVDSAGNPSIVREVSLTQLFSPQYRLAMFIC